MMKGADSPFSRKGLNHLYHASSRRIRTVKVPAMNFIMVDGSCEGSTYRDFRNGIEGIFTLSRALRTVIATTSIGIDYPEMPLECLWWVNGGGDFTPDNRGDWKWILMMVQPEYATAALVKEVLRKIDRHKAPPGIFQIRHGRFAEGLSVQMLHDGPHATKGATMKRLQSYIEKKGYHIRGRYHEIYLSDPRTIDPDCMQTIIRLPIA